jgi:RNA polymerase sigma-70 factor (ECF subfamily)
MMESLIDEHATKLVRYCYGILGNYSDAEDVAQTLFIKLCLSPDRLLDIGAIPAYLYKAAYHACIDILRRNKRVVLMPDVEKIQKGSYTESYDREFPQDMKKALKTLRPADRTLVVGRVVADLSYTELESILGKSEQTLRKRYERAKNKLASEISSGG